jgi:hypothetical protein
LSHLLLCPPLDAFYLPEKWKELGMKIIEQGDGMMVYTTNVLYEGIGKVKINNTIFFCSLTHAYFLGQRVSFSSEPCATKLAASVKNGRCVIATAVFERDRPTP